MQCTWTLQLKSKSKINYSEFWKIYPNIDVSSIYKIENETQNDIGTEYLRFVG